MFFISNRLEFKQHIDKAGEGKEKVQAQLDEIHELMREISGKLSTVVSSVPLGSFVLIPLASSVSLC